MQVPWCGQCREYLLRVMLRIGRRCRPAFLAGINPRPSTVGGVLRASPIFAEMNPRFHRVRDAEWAASSRGSVKTTARIGCATKPFGNRRRERNLPHIAENREIAQGREAERARSISQAHPPWIRADELGALSAVARSGAPPRAEVGERPDQLCFRTRVHR